MCQEKITVDVAIPIPVFSTFTYEVPSYLVDVINIGKRVLVPFQNRRVIGYIMGWADSSSMNGIKLISDIIDQTPLFPQTMVPFFKWIAEYYLYPIGEVIRCALPSGLTHSEDMFLTATEQGKARLSSGKLTPLQSSILQLIVSKPCTLNSLRKQIDSTNLHSLVYLMEKSGYIQIQRMFKKDRAKSKKESFVSLIQTPNFSDDHLSDQKRAIVQYLQAEGMITLKELFKRFPDSKTHIRSLEKKGIISVIDKQVYRDPFGESIVPDTPLQLTSEQTDVFEQLRQSFGKGFVTYLLAGVTGSGKTEVYLQACAEVIQRGFSVIVLVPEIALISQTERRFRSRFGECVAVLHSGLSSGERFDQWMRIIRKEVKIVVGARSAIFAPFDDLGLIIVDEEHDSSYKQETDLLYHARDLAIVRAKQLGIMAILGSATPSIQSLYNADIGKYQKISLTSRVENRPLPNTTIIDLRKNRDERGIRRFLTSELIQGIQDRLNRNEQTLLFLNRRGFATFPLCESCGTGIRCVHCDITLTYHHSAKILKCHLCGFIIPYSSVCPVCHSSNIKLLGIGTEKIEAAVTKLFPGARVARMDKDTTSKKGALLTILKELRNHQIDILVGTQMITKGHDFPNITLVGIICADLSMNFPDFRSGETAFQLIAQVSGRAGRGDIPGVVMLQTYNPNHFTILAAKTQDYQQFYNTEIKLRQALNYPPFSRIALIRLSGKDQKMTKDFAINLGSSCHSIRKELSSYSKMIEIHGPVECFVSKIEDRYRWQILIKAKHSDILHELLKRIRHKNSSLFRQRSVQVIIDIDPIFLM